MKKKTLKTNFKTEWPLHLFLLPAVILLLIFSYFPMVGILIAFQDYVPSKGWDLFFKSEWVGLDNFKYIMTMPGFWTAMRNTLIIAIQKIAVNIFVPLFLALLLNEVKNRLFKKSVQTIIYIPYFFSWVILGGIGIYQPLVDFAGAGASVPLLGFGNTLARGVREAVQEDGFLGILTGGLKATAGGITVAIFAGLLVSLIFKPKDKT